MTETPETLSGGSTVDDLLGRWLAVTAPQTRATAASEGRAVLDRYGEPGRHYHGLRHLAHVLAHVDELSRDARLAASRDDLVVVRLAAFFHDAVYETRRSDNEERSSVLAGSVLTRLGFSAVVRAEVTRLVLLTATHDPAPDDLAGALLCDADLAILGCPPHAYWAYTRAVRAEFAHIPDDRFQAGRSVVLRALVDRPFVFTTKPAREWWEARAQANVAAELDLLATS